MDELLDRTDSEAGDDEVADREEVRRPAPAEEPIPPLQADDEPDEDRDILTDGGD